MSTKDNKPPAILASEVTPRTQKSNYPSPFAERVSGKLKRPLGDFFGIKKFGVNLTELAPNGESTLLHKHSKQEEFIYIISGHPTLITGETETILNPGMCAGFTPDGSAHQLINRTSETVTYLDLGDRIAGDEVSYPADDLMAVMDENQKWKFKTKNGKPY